jgi:catechol 2,3-dioxygenase-like lactoylglutathione lyase family enzyme
VQPLEPVHPASADVGATLTIGVVPGIADRLLSLSPVTVTGMSAATFAWTIVYVDDVARSTAFYGAAFGFTVRLTHPEGQYAELDTGATVLAFTGHALAGSNVPGGYTRHDPVGPPLAVELAFTTDDVPAAIDAAVAAGGRLLAAPVVKPWGQTVGYVRDPDGVLIEIATPLP